MALEMTFRLLIPDKKGVGKKIANAIRSAGGEVESTCVKREMRGMSEAEIRVSFVHESFRSPIVLSLAQVSGVALIGRGEPITIERPHS